MNWRRILHRGSEFEGMLNELPASTQGTVRSFMGRWAGFSHWVDGAMARAWLNRVLHLTRDGVETSVHAMSYADQVAYVVDVHEALGHVYQALDLPPHSDPEFRRVFERDIAGGRANPYEDGPRWEDIPRANDPPPRTLPPIPAWAQWARANGAFRGTDGSYALVFHHRLMFRPNGEVDTRYIRAGEESTDYWTHHHFYRPDGSPDWRSWAFHHNCMSRPGGGNCEWWESTFFPPLTKYFEQVREIARSIAARGLLLTIAQARRWAFFLNARTAKRLGLLRTTPGQGAGFERIAGLDELDLERARQSALSDVDDVGSLLTDLSNGPAAAVPQVALVLGVVGSAARLLALLPPAVARVTDVWFRNVPVFETSAISGGQASGEVPDQVVPDPPNWTRPPPVAEQGFEVAPPGGQYGVFNAPGGGGVSETIATADTVREGLLQREALRRAMEEAIARGEFEALGRTLPVVPPPPRPPPPVAPSPTSSGVPWGWIAAAVGVVAVGVAASKGR